MAPAVTIRHLTYSYFDLAAPALNDCTLNIPAGACCAVLGATGSGKTTLLQAIGGVLGSQYATGKASGTITIGDSMFAPLPPSPLFPAVGYSLPDASLQLSGIKETVRDEVGFTLDNIGITDPEREQRLLHTLSSLAIQHLEHRSPTRLSGGELQRVALASILVAQPSLLLLDEPANGLDGLAQQKLIAVLRSLKGTSTLIISDYNIDLALSLADRFVVMVAGSIRFDGHRAEFLRQLPSFKNQLPVALWEELLHSKALSKTPERIKRFLVQ